MTHLSDPGRRGEGHEPTHSVHIVVMEPEVCSSGKNAEQN